MSTLPKSRIRIAGDLFRFERLVDLLRPFQTNAFEEEIPLVPRFHGADSLQVEVAVFNDGTLLNDLSAIAQLELTIKPLQADDQSITDFDDPNPDAKRGPASNVAPIVCKRIDSADFNPALTEGQWQSKAADMAHAILTLDSEEAALAPGERWLSLVALGHDNQARTLAAGPVLILGGGATFNALPQPVVKDLRDQAAQSAAQAQQSADAAAMSAGAAHNAALAAQTEATLANQSASAAEASATEATEAIPVAQQAVNDAAQARDAAQQFAADAQSAAQNAAQSADRIGDLDAALAQAGSDADRAEAASTTAESAALLAQSAADGLNPLRIARAGGVFFEQTGYARIDGVTPAALSVGSFTLSWCGKVTARGIGMYNCLLGNTRGISSYHVGAVGLAIGNVIGENRAIFCAEQSVVDIITIRTPESPSIMDRVAHLAGVYDHSTKEARLYQDGELIATGDWSAALLDSPYRMSLMQAVTGNGSVDWQRSPEGDTHHAAIFDRALTPAEIAELASSGGQVVPLSARAALLVDLAMDEGNGYQLRDRSGNGNHALLAGTGSTHLIPGRRFEFVWTRVSSGFLGDADRPVLPEGAVIESIIWEDSKGTKTTASLGYNASNIDTHVASFTPAQPRQSAALAAASMAVADRRLYLHMSANAGAVTVHVRGRIL